MADSHEHGGHGHHGPNMVTYLSIAGALAVFTAMSFVFNGLVPKYISHMTSLWLILGVAVCKATLVTLFFMHVKYDWGKLYFMIIPVMILGIMMMLVLMPDGVVAWRH